MNMMTAMPPTEIFNDRPRPRRIHHKRDRWHLLQRGCLMTLVLDLETLGLLPHVTIPQSYGDALGDISFNFLDQKKIELRVPDRYVVSPEAALITGLDPFEAHSKERMPFGHGISRIAERLEFSAFRFHEMGHPSKDIEWDIIRKSKAGRTSKRVIEKSSIYKTLDDDGRVVDDVMWLPDTQKVALRVDHNPYSYYHDKVGGYFAENRDDGSQWKLIDPTILFAGFRNIFFDIPVLQDAMCFAGYHRRNVQFASVRTAMTTKQRPRNQAIDAYSIFSHVYNCGAQGEDGFDIAEIIDPRTGHMAASMKQDLLYKMNRREGNKLRNIHPGLFMPDGSIHQTPLAHRNPDYDSLASFALYGDMLDRAPNIVAIQEKQSNEDGLRNELSPTQITNDNTRKIFLLSQNTYPKPPRTEPYIFIGFDDLIGKRGRAIFVRANVDLARFTLNGKTLKELDASELAQMLEKHKDDSDPLIKILKIKKWRGATPLEDAIGARGTQNIDFDILPHSYGWLVSNRDVIGKLLDAVAIQNDARSMRPPYSNPTAEEDIRYHATGELDYIEGEQDEMRSLVGMPLNVADFIYNRAVDDFNFMINMDAIMHAIAIQPLPIDYCDDDWALAHYNTLIQNRMGIVKKKKNLPYWQKLKNIDENLEEFTAHKTRVEFTSHDHARSYRQALRQQIMIDNQALSDDPNIAFGNPNYIHNSYGKMGKFILYNPLRNSYHVVDKMGRRLEMEWIERQDPAIVKAQFKKGHWSIRHYRMSSDPSISFLLDQFMDDGSIRDLPPVYLERAKNRDIFLVRGEPDVDAEIARFGLERQRLALKKIISNTAVGSMFAPAYKPEGYIGAADKFARGEIAQWQITRFQDYLDAKEKQFPRDNSNLLAAQFDPQTKLPLMHFDYEIPDDHYAVIDVPDRHLDMPLEDRSFMPYALIIPSVNDIVRQKINAGLPVVLRSMETGACFYAGPCAIVKAPDETSSRYADFYNRAQKAYNDSGQTFPEDRHVMIIEGVHAIQKNNHVDLSRANLKLSKDQFIQTVWPRGVQRNKPLTGVILRSNYMPMALNAGQSINLLQTNEDDHGALNGQIMEGDITGHGYQTTVTHVTALTLQTLYDDIVAQKIDDLEAQNNGYPSAWDMFEIMNKTLLDLHVPNPMTEPLTRIKFETIDKKSWFFSNIHELPKAIIYKKHDHFPHIAHAKPK